MAAYLETDGLKLRRKVRALVFNEHGEVLLIRPHGYRDGEWTLAGGGVEAGESPVEAMRREIAEELGVTLEGEPTQLPMWVVERQQPDRWDVLGAGVSIIGASIILFAPRSA